MESTVFMASAGSGKTSMLIEVLKEYIDKGGDGKKVLVISYTNNAVEEILHRVAKVLDASIVESLNIHTLHSFCYSYMREQDILNDINIVENIGSELLMLVPSYLTSKLNISPWELGEFLNKISTENVYYTYFNREEYINTYGEEESLNINLRTQDAIVSIIQFIQQVLGYFSFSDLIIKMYEILRVDSSHLNHLLNLWNSYDLILIDEMQDFSPMQTEIMMSILKEIIYNSPQTNNREECLAVSKKFYLFGDIKQSIFNFQGAQVEFFKEQINQLYILSKQNQYPCFIKRINLTHRLGDKINKFINQLHNLTALPHFEFHKTTSKIQGAVYYQKSLITTTEDSLVEDIYTLVEYLLESRYQPNDIMIIFRTRDRLVYKLGEKLKNSHLQSNGLDITSIGENSKLSVFLKDIVHLLGNSEEIFNWIVFIGEYLINYMDSNQKTLIISHINNKNCQSIMNSLSMKGPVGELWDLLVEYVNKPNNIHGYSFIMKLLKTTIGSNIIAGEKQGLFFYLLREMRDFEGGLKSFLEKTPTSVKLYQNGVQMHTVYGSKGLQSKVVIICDSHRGCISKEWQGKFFSPSSKIPLSEKDRQGQSIHNNLIFEEYLRLMYVATTRASEELYIFGNYPVEIKSLLWYLEDSFISIPIKIGDLSLNILQGLKEANENTSH